MANQAFKVDTKRLGSEADKVNQLLADIQSEYKLLGQEVQALSVGWKGYASSSFLLTFREDCEQMENIMEKLTEYCADLKEAQGTYNRCEHDVGSKVWWL